jgi:hypothetical protein
MSMLRLIAASLFASASIIAAAQTSATSLTPGVLPAQPFTSNQSLFTDIPPQTFSMKQPPTGPYTPKPYSFQVAPPSEATVLRLSANNNSPKLQVEDQELSATFANQQAHLTALAENSQPCYKLHVYGFTPHDLKSPHPQPSTETDCTEASSSHLKVIQLPAATQAK